LCGLAVTWGSSPNSCIGLSTKNDSQPDTTAPRDVGHQGKRVAASSSQRECSRPPCTRPLARRRRSRIPRDRVALSGPFDLFGRPREELVPVGTHKVMRTRRATSGTDHKLPNHAVRNSYQASLRLRPVLQRKVSHTYGWT